MKEIIAAVTLCVALCAGAAAGVEIEISARGETLHATLEDCPTTRVLVEKLPLTLPMLDLYCREMCYRFEDAPPTGTLTSSAYDVGDMIHRSTAS